MRVPFLLAVASGHGQDVIDAVTSLFWIPRGVSVADDRLTERRCGCGHRLVYVRDGDALEFHATRLASGVNLGVVSAGDGGAWDVWMMMPATPDDAVGPRAQRKLRRAVLAQGAQKWLLGPYGMPALLRAKPAVYAAIVAEHDDAENESGLVRSWPVFAGDDPGTLAAIDYDPSDADCIADTEWTP